MKAIAILHVDPEVAQTALDGVKLTALDDCVLLPLDLPLTADPGQLAARIRELAGPVVELHREERGVPVLPDTYALEAKTWAAAVEELGEAADWIAPAPASPMAGMEGLLAAFGGGGGMPGGEGMPDMGALAAQLQGEQGQALIEQAMAMAQQLAGSGGLEELARAMGAPPGAAQPPTGDPQGGEPESQQSQGGQSQSGQSQSGEGAAPDDPEAGGPAQPEAFDPTAALQQLGANPEALEGMDLEAMKQQAQAMMQGMDLSAMAEQAQAMLAGNPELQRQLEAMAGATPTEPAPPPEGSDEEE